MLATQTISVLLRTHAHYHYDCQTANISMIQYIRRTFYGSFICLYTGVFAEMEKLFKNLLTISTSGTMPNEDSP